MCEMESPFVEKPNFLSSDMQHGYFWDSFLAIGHRTYLSNKSYFI